MAFKIDGSSSKKPDRLTTNISRDAGRVNKKNGMQFSSQLGRHMSQNQEEELKKWPWKLKNRVKSFPKTLIYMNWKVYKRLVMEFLDEAVRGFGRFSKESFLDRRGRHRVFAVVKTINEELEKLTRDVLASEKDNLKIISRIEDIRGLVLDLIL